MKFTVVPAAFFLCYCVAACNNLQTSKAPLADKKDIEACEKIYQESLFAIKSSGEAITRSTSAHTKKLAQYFLEKNQRIKNDFEEVAGRLRFKLPFDISQQQKQAWESLVKQKGFNFDKTFIEMVSVLDNKEQNLLVKISKEATDTTIRKVAVRLMSAASAAQSKHELENKNQPESLEKQLPNP